MRTGELRLLLFIFTLGWACVPNLNEMPCTSSEQCPTGQLCDSVGTDEEPNQPVCRKELKGTK